MHQQKMKTVSAGLITSAVIVIAATGSALANDQYRLIDAPEDFADAFIGQKIMDPEDANNFFVIGEDGTIAGTWYGGKLEGAWRWEEGYFCRTLSLPRPAPEDCQEWYLGDGSARLTRDRGKGESTIYALGEN